MVVSFTVKIKGRGFDVKDATGSSDPYLILRRASDRSELYRTEVIQRCLNPEWRPVTLVNLEPGEQVLLESFDQDLITRDDFIGSACVSVLSLLDEDEEVKLLSKKGALAGTLHFSDVYRTDLPDDPDFSVDGDVLPDCAPTKAAKSTHRNDGKLDVETKKRGNNVDFVFKNKTMHVKIFTVTFIKSQGCTIPCSNGGVATVEVPPGTKTVAGMIILDKRYSYRCVTERKVTDIRRHIMCWSLSRDSGDQFLTSKAACEVDVLIVFHNDVLLAQRQAHA